MAASSPARAKRGPESRGDAATNLRLEGPVNEVRLRGRLADRPETRRLPSGDEVVTFRLVVRRRRTRGSQVSVDTIDCTVWGASLRRRASAWLPGDVLVVEGALRRRFWRSPQGARSRYDVEVQKVTRARRAD
jgi:single-strand DNA-binding protein